MANYISFVCEQCGTSIPVLQPPTPNFRLEVTCPKCAYRNTYERPIPPKLGAAETKASAPQVEFRTPEGRFLGEYDPRTMTLTLPYRGQNHCFSIATGERR